MFATSFFGILEAENRGYKREEKLSDLLEDNFLQTKTREVSQATLIRALFPLSPHDLITSQTPHLQITPR